MRLNCETLRSKSLLSFKAARMKLKRQKLVVRLMMQKAKVTDKTERNKRNKIVEPTLGVGDSRVIEILHARRLAVLWVQRCMRPSSWWRPLHSAA